MKKLQMTQMEGLQGGLYLQSKLKTNLIIVALKVI
jgi:hypothetical protein